VLALNFAVPSLLNFYWRSPEPIRWERFLRYIIRLHAETVGPFTRRPVTTALLREADAFFQNAWLSFLSVQGALLTAGALALHLAARREDGPRAALLSQLIYFASFTILFSFVTPNDAFDEPAQYFFLFLALYFLRAGYAAAFSATFFLACLSRETSLLAVPGLLLLEERRPTLRCLPKYLLPIAAWAVFYFGKEAPGDPGRFLYWTKNFASGKISFETLVSASLALGLPAATYFADGGPRLRARWTKAFFLTLALNTPIVLYAAYARESRLLALPLIFLWPRCGGALLAALPKMGRPHWAGLGVAAIAAGAVWVSYHPVYRHVLGYRIYAGSLPFFALIPLSRRLSSGSAPYAGLFCSALRRK
jgi:hypothetical protein